MSIEPGPTRRAKRVALAQAAMIALLLLAAGCVGLAAHAGTGAAQGRLLGRTWPIAERDALEEIEAKAARLPRDMAKAFGPRTAWSALRAAGLGVAAGDQIRHVVPFYTLPFEIRLPGGQLLYPKGFSFNPLTYVTMPQRLVVVHPRDLPWALRTARQSDFILLSAHDGRQSDPIDLSEKSGRAIYILEERVKDRLGLTVAPVIVAQTGQSLTLTEFGPRVRNPIAGKGAPR